MGRKRTRKGKYIYFRIASLIFLSFLGCATIEKTKQRVEVSPPLSETKEQAEVGGIPLGKTKGAEEIEIEIKEEEKTRERVKTNEYLFRGQKLLTQGDYEGSLRENQKILSVSAHKPPGDEALFNMGLIYAHSANPKRDYGKSLDFFKKLLKDFPQSPLVEQAKIWIGVLQENEKLTQMLEKSKQVDIEIEERKREKTK